jgi:hypothetical protein
MWTTLLVLLAVSPAALAEEEVAAKINGQAIPLTEIDAPSRPKIARLHHAWSVKA